jgi:hypothetical protein
MTNKIAVLDHENRNAVKWVDPAPKAEIGDCPAGRVAVVRADGTRIGHVGHGAGASVAERLLKRPVELGEHKGNAAWVEKKGAVTLQAQGALDKAVHDASLRAAKGSVGEPHKPETHARPHRGG